MNATTPACQRFGPRRRAGLVGLVVVALAGAVSAGAADKPGGLKELVEIIATGDEVESAAAAQELIDRMTTPLLRAIGSLENRPIEQQVRLRQALARLDRTLRMRMFRLDLPPADRALFDRFARAYPELTLRAFDTNYRVRLAAVDQIPLEPDTGAGVLIAAKVNDEDEDVATAALKVALRLHDRVVARCLRRYVRDATQAVASGFYGPESQDLAHAVAIIVFRSIQVIGQSGFARGHADVAAALRYFGRSKYWDVNQRASAIAVLGKLGDRRAAPVLLEFLDDPAQHRWDQPENAPRVVQTVGDAALLALARIYGFQPARFGMRVSPRNPDIAGYTNERTRAVGHRAFRVWYAGHVERAGPSSRPAASRPARRSEPRP